MVNEIIVAFLGTLLLMNHSESKPVTPSRPRPAERPPIITRPAVRFIPPGRASGGADRGEGAEDDDVRQVAVLRLVERPTARDQANLGVRGVAVDLL